MNRSIIILVRIARVWSGAEQKDAMSSVMGFVIVVWKANHIRGKKAGARIAITRKAANAGD
jgi:hypothetical protein